MSLARLLLGVIDVAIVVAVLILIGLIVAWFASWMGFPIPDQIRKVYMVIVALIALYLLVALVIGMPTARFLSGFPGGTIVAVTAGNHGA